MQLTDAPKIEPISDDHQRPRWSVMIPTYNCASYLRQTLESVLAQDAGQAEMQIEVIDDCSQADDDSEAVVREVARGRVGFYRHSKNRGVAATFNTCVARSRGEFVHILHGDDILLPTFYRAYERFFADHPSCIMMCNRAIAIDEDNNWLYLLHSAYETRHSGIVPDAKRRLLKENLFIAPTVVVRREAYESVGGFLPNLAHTADWEMWIRLSDYGSIGYIQQPHLLYRIHEHSHTAVAIRTGAVIAESLLVLRTVLRRCSRDERRVLHRIGRHGCAEIAHRTSVMLQYRGDYAIAIKHSLIAVSLWRSAKNVLRLVRSFWRYGVGSVRLLLRKSRGTKHGPASIR